MVQTFNCRQDLNLHYHDSDISSEPAFQPFANSFSRDLTGVRGRCFYDGATFDGVCSESAGGDPVGAVPGFWASGRFGHCRPPFNLKSIKKSAGDGWKPSIGRVLNFLGEWSAQ